MPFIRKKSTEGTTGIKTYDVAKPDQGEKLNVLNVSVRLSVGNPFAKYHIALLDESGVVGKLLTRGVFGSHLNIGHKFKEDWPDNWKLRFGFTCNTATDVFRLIEWEYEQ